MTSSEWIAAGGLALAGLVALLGFLQQRHARSESYRAALYAAQLAAVRDLLSASGEFHHVALRLARREPGTTVNVSMEDLDAATTRVDDARSAGAAVLPKRVLEASAADIRTLLATLFDQGTTAERREAIQLAWTELVDAIRTEMGGDALGAEVRRLIGVTAAERDAALVASYQDADRIFARGRNSEG